MYYNIRSLFSFTAPNLFFMVLLSIKIKILISDSEVLIPKEITICIGIQLTNSRENIFSVWIYFPFEYFFRNMTCEAFPTKTWPEFSLLNSLVKRGFEVLKRLKISFRFRNLTYRTFFLPTWPTISIINLLEVMKRLKSGKFVEGLTLEVHEATWSGNWLKA